MPKRSTKRGAPNRTATASTPEGELQRHLRDLGLASTEAYRVWCREHGFGSAIHKDWQERRQEAQCARKLAEEATARAERLRHIAALGLKDEAEYVVWCGRHGFSTALNKGRSLLRQEQQVAEREKAQAALAGARRHQRKPQSVIEGIFLGEIGQEELKTDLHRELFALYGATEGQPEVREAMLRLLLYAQKQTRLVSLERAVPFYGDESGNSFVRGLAALARFQAEWKRTLEAWKPDSYNVSRQFGALARHLLADYPVPAFMDSVWFKGDSEEALRQQRWFIHIGIGKNIRRADLPLLLPEKAAHYFLQAPRDFTVEAALRWGQIHALGGDEYLARAVAASRLGAIQEDEAFWATVLHFFVNNPMLDSAALGPIVDFIHHRRFAPREVIGEDGQPHLAGPPEPDFAMKGRTVAALWRRVEAWHRELAKETRKLPMQWESSGIGAFQLTERDAETGAQVCWRIEEIVTHRDLVEEGKTMRHCVASYARSCAKGAISVWTMTMEDCRTGSRRNVMTIEVQNARRFIAQARGRCNKAPGEKRASQRLNKAPAVLKQWAEQERLTVPSYIPHE